jgi:hypothetical protein
VIYFAFLLPFAHSNFIFNSKRNFLDEDETLISYFSESEVISSIYQQYFFSLGDFYSDNFNSFGNRKNKWMLWLFLVISTLISTVTMLNMLVNIMGDVFGRLEPFKSQIGLFMLFLLMANDVDYLDGDAPKEFTNLYFIKEQSQDEEESVIDFLKDMSKQYEEKENQIMKKMDEQAQVMQNDIFN